MADEAFALSPISARSASPTDADYDAIREAFLETARGRWFLGEYAKRNRNADTAMVLDAVTRIEQSLAASRAETAAMAPEAKDIPAASPAIAPDELLASVKMILERTRAALVAALPMPGLEQALSPFQRSARIIQEIAWGLRESGSDGRICSILDTQVGAMTAACEALASADHRDAILHAFDASLIQIGKLSQRDTVLPVDMIDEPAAAVNDSHRNPGNAAPTDDAQIATAPIPANSPVMAEAVVEPAASSMSAAIPASPQTAIADSGTTRQAQAPRSSLGDSLIAHGIVAPTAALPDPLAPIRRMSQAEKIAFFS